MRKIIVIPGRVAGLIFSRHRLIDTDSKIINIGVNMLRKIRSFTVILLILLLSAGVVLQEETRNHPNQLQTLIRKNL